MPNNTIIRLQNSGVQSKIVVSEYLIPEEMVKYLSRFYGFKRFADVPHTLPATSMDVCDYFMRIRRHL